jgi:hypothetical protein
LPVRVATNGATDVLGIEISWSNSIDQETVARAGQVRATAYRC